MKPSVAAKICRRWATAFAVSLQDIAGANASSAVQNVILMPLRGFVDYVTPTLVEGWAQDLRAPESPVFLELIVDGAVAAQFYANIARRDLAEAGLGSGRHSFSCKLPTALTAAQCESVYVRRVSDGLFLGRYKPKTN